MFLYNYNSFNNDKQGQGLELSTNSSMDTADV